jgi:hypothetical protein
VRRAWLAAAIGATGRRVGGKAAARDACPCPWKSVAGGIACMCPPWPRVGWRPREGAVLRPRQAGSPRTAARPTARAFRRCWPRDQLAASLSRPRRVGSGLRGSSKGHRPGVPHAVRGESTTALTRPRVARGGVCMSVPRPRNASTLGAKPKEEGPNFTNIGRLRRGRRLR